MYLYKDLEKHFISPKRISPFYNDYIKIPRKLKNKVKRFCGVHWEGLTNGQRLWHYLGKNNPDYKRYLIKMICSNYDASINEHSLIFANSESITKDSIGTIVHVYENKDMYEVEFIVDGLSIIETISSKKIL